MVTCSNCRKEVDRLELFPKDLCLECWADTPEGRYVPTADELTVMWGGKV